MKKLVYLVILSLTCGGLLFAAVADDPATDIDESALQSMAQVERAQNVSEATEEAASEEIAQLVAAELAEATAEANRITAELAEATAEANRITAEGIEAAAEQALADAQVTETAAKAKVAELEALVDELTATYPELVEMRNIDKMGWGEIAKAFGLHPSVLGLKRGHTKKSENGMTARNMKAFKGTTLASNSNGNAYGLEGKAAKSNNAKGSSGNSIGAASSNNGKGKGAGSSNGKSDGKGNK